VRFIAEDEDRTVVQLEHRGLREAYGAGAEQIHTIFDSADGWDDILGRYARAADH
jgi:hypothetical protein